MAAPLQDVSSAGERLPMPPMYGEIDKVQPPEVLFVEVLKQSENSTIFKVVIREKLCVMKMYPEKERPDAFPDDLKFSLFIRENMAYRRLKAKGLCKQGVIPDFYGTIECIQPRFWRPHLDMFLEDELPPNAVFIEYIPNMHKLVCRGMFSDVDQLTYALTTVLPLNRLLDFSTFSTGRLEEFRSILDKIHEAKVLLGDVFPRNMMVVTGNSNRALWIDFDNAQVFPEDTLTWRQTHWLAEEDELADYFIENLPKDYEEGSLNRVWNYYYNWGS